MRFSLPGGVFPPCGHELDFLHQLVREFNHSIKLYCIRLYDRHDPITFMRPCARHSTLDVQLTFFLGTIDELLEL